MAKSGEDLLPLWSSDDEGRRATFHAAVRLYSVRLAEKRAGTNAYNRLLRSLASVDIDVEDIKVALLLEKSPGEIPAYADKERYKRVALILGMALGEQMDLPLEDE